MSEPSPSDSSLASRSPNGGAFDRKGFRFLGLGLQDVIRVFFGGNASLAIVVLVLICVFLAMEAVRFFPDHHEGLKSYRLSGQEFVDYIKDEVDAHTNFYSAANIAYFAEVNRTSEEEDNILRAYRAVLANVENLTAKTSRRHEREEEALEELSEKKAELAEELEELRNPDAPAENADRIAALEQEIAALEARAAERRPIFESLEKKLTEEVAVAIDREEAWNLGVGTDQPPSDSRPRIREAVLHAATPGVDDEHEYIEQLKETSREKKAVEAERLADWKETLKEIQAAVKPVRDLAYELRDPASENKKQIVSYSTAGARKEAWEKGAAATEDPAEKQRMLEEAAKVVIEEPDYEAINQVFYDAVPRHAEVAAPFEIEMSRLAKALPDSSGVESKSARENLERAEVFYERLEKRILASRERVKVWHHDKPLSAVQSVSAFLLGKNWITNSSWHDFYGLLPIFTGSLLIAVIALVVAVPFSVSAAVYVNQLASHREQNLVKPAIEFIEAIPSVVLGFFGILVFGETLRAISQVEWLEWVPGFPMAERLTILNAGLLLAFMAMPTIFTLTEDALNNVPQAFTENSLAMGATKLQTVFRVIIPTAVSGIIAAVLLGFGRIVGETMVVLLVAGNKIKIPDFTEGLGVIAQPAHTMTGIIAQELGEVDHGSLHWRALFMVGMVLFTISLLVNFAAQRVLKRFERI